MDADEWPSLERLEEICGWAARVHWTGLLSYQDRFEAAWDGITDAIMAGDEDLGFAALNGISRERGKMAHHHGLPVDRTAQTGARHAAYWHGSQRLRDPFEVADDKMALHQIWPKLRPADRRALQSLADADLDYGVAAHLSGWAYETWLHKLSAARRYARELWFEPETPPRRTWGRVDRRRQAGGWRQAAAIIRYKRRRERDGDRAAG